MNNVVTILIGLFFGYVIGIVLAAILATVFGFEDAARFVAIGCGMLGAVVATPVARRLEEQR